MTDSVIKQIAKGITNLVFLRSCDANDDLNMLKDFIEKVVPIQHSEVGYTEKDLEKSIIVFLTERQNKTFPNRWRGPGRS
jgi:hypothetical protein